MVLLPAYPAPLAADAARAKVGFVQLKGPVHSSRHAARLAQAYANVIDGVHAQACKPGRI